jgi:Xaa-Pro dipeptidase
MAPKRYRIAAPHARARRERARSIASGRPLLVADPATVTWLTGLAVEINWGPRSFSAPPLAVLDPDGSLLAIASQDDAGGVAAGVDVRTFPGFAVEDADRPAAARALALEAVAGAAELAVELDALPGGVAARLASDGVRLVDVAADLREARAVKDADELAAIRAAVAIAGVGQAAARAALRPGRTEIDIWADVHHAMQSAAGERVPVLADIVTGERTADVGGSPGGRVVADGDLLLCDLVPRIGGYWADSCSTVATGEPPPGARAARDLAEATLRRAVDAIAPGVAADEIDALCRNAMGGYPHHTGHGVGAAMHEQPRIVPGNGQRLEPGMVIALEPGSYTARWGVRVEWVVAVTDSGCEVLSGHSIAM